MRFLYFLILLCFSSFAYGQINLSGRVINSVTQAPVVNATVYLDNTSIGTITNENGEFSINADMSGSFDLVVSHIAFQKKIMHIGVGEKTNSLLISLDVKTNSLNEVSITNNSLKSWKKWRKLFTEYFIGTMEFAKKCAIQNPEVLVFHYDKAGQILKVTSNKPLLVENKALGYLYKMDLNSFIYSFNALTVHTEVTTFFENIHPANATEQKTFLTNREQAYYGSKMHFIRAVYQKNYTRQGFSVIAIHLKSNDEKYRLQQMVSKAVAKAYQENTSVREVTLLSLANGNRDTVKYYEQLLGEPGFVIKDTSSVSLNDSLAFDANRLTAKLHLKDTILIQYNELHDKKAVAFELPVKNASFILSDKQKHFQRKKEDGLMEYTLLRLMPEKAINLYANGGYDGDDIFTKGQMANGKIAYLLPWDYKNDE